MFRLVQLCIDILPTGKEINKTIMNENQKQPPKKVIDISSVVLLIIGIISGLIAFHLVRTTDLGGWVFVPSIIATITGTVNLTTIKGAR